MPPRLVPLFSYEGVLDFPTASHPLNDDGGSAYFVTAFADEMLQSRREVWAGLAEAVMENSSRAQLLRGAPIPADIAAPIPADIAAQMPEPLRSNIQIVVDLKRST